jgi:serine protease Do
MQSIDLAMRILLSPILVGAVAATLPMGTSRAEAEDNAETVFREARAYTVRIRTQIPTPFIEDERGSFEGAGFLVDAERGWVITNAHVVGRSPSAIQVAFAGQPYHPARKIYVDPFEDIAVIELSEEVHTHPTAPLNCEGRPEVGESVGAFGHPLGMPFTGSRGIISGETDKFGPDLIQIDATVDRGNSGGPVISLRDGTVVGIATAMAGNKKEDRLNFATPIRNACRILDRLRAGDSPSPPQMAVVLLKDEDGRLTLQVESTHDPEHWPLVQGDRILGVEGADSARTVGELVNTLRGRTGNVPLVVERDGRTQTVGITPALRPSLIERRGISIDGALIAPIAFEDALTLREPAPLIVQSVEPGSTAEMLEIGPNDIIRSVEGQRFDDLDRLVEYLTGRPEGTPLTIVLRRWSQEQNRIFDYHLRQLPGEDVYLVEPDGSRN